MASDNLAEKTEAQPLDEQVELLEAVPDAADVVDDDGNNDPMARATKELEVMRRLLKALNPLPKDSQQRILAWLGSSLVPE